MVPARCDTSSRSTLPTATHALSLTCSSPAAKALKRPQSWLPSLGTFGKEETLWFSTSKMKNSPRSLAVELKMFGQTRRPSLIIGVLALILPKSL
jgi:hypothetical protein